MKEPIKIKYNNKTLIFEYSEVGGGYKNCDFREMWYYTEDRALFIWSISGRWKRVSRKEYEVAEVVE